MNTIYLIGGSPTAGKTYLAKKLSKELDLPWISTDMIREQMRQLLKPSDHPDLFKTADATPEMALKVLNKLSPREIVETENNESREVWAGVKALIESDYVWGSFIIEGVAILPELVSQIKIDNKKIHSIYLINSDVAKIRNVIFTRGLWDDADKYPDSIKEKEIDWVVAFNDWISSQAQKFNFPIIDTADDNYYSQIVELLK